MKNIDNLIQRKFQNNISSALSHLLVFKSENTKHESLYAYIDILHNLALYVQVRIKDDYLRYSHIKLLSLI